MALFFNRLIVSFLLLFQAGCSPKITDIGSKKSSSDKTKKVLLINGAGASFPYILYLKWFSEYRRLKPEVAINYQSIGSGGGIRQFLKGTLDFGATDVPVSEKDVKKKEREQILHIPTALGAVALTYNLDLKKGEVLRLEGKVLADIFQGKIKKWNHPSLQKLNENISLPDEPIITVYRADGSGTTAFFTEFLAQWSPEFLKKIGKGKSVQWPMGVGGKGNEGVVGLVNKMKGAMGYISASYAVVQKLPVARIKNQSGSFVSPMTKAIMSAAENAMKKNKDYLASMINPPGEESYPLSGFTYIILSRKMPERKGRILVEFLKWALNDGQGFSEALNFNPLPESVRQVARKKLSEVQFQ
ncbi:MAG: phosphate ABC transporter substrate-binding protein PstS [Bdellovibrionales bacterium]|nr:phosphate ABC transporter substrate-binding protein PstS [Bdellovibrionales bacterium]